MTQNNMIYLGTGILSGLIPEYLLWKGIIDVWKKIMITTWIHNPGYLVWLRPNNKKKNMLVQ